MSNEVFFGIIILVNIICSVIIVRHKNTIIKDLQSVMQSADIKRLAEYYEAHRKVHDKLVVDKVELAVDLHMREQYEVWGKQYDELATFAAEFILVFPKERREEIIDLNFPNCKPLFQDILDKPVLTTSVLHSEERSQGQR
ncbi:MAG TPA: hypothetical protein VIU35_15455 [Chitinophagaceae bacterium]